MNLTTTDDQKSIAAEAFRDLLYYWWVDGGAFSKNGRADFYGRSIILTPYSGNYGHPAGWVACVEGSPSRLTLHIDGCSSMLFEAFLIGRKSRRVSGSEQRETIRMFIETWLDHAKGVITLRGQAAKAISVKAVYFDDDVDFWHWG